MGRVWVSDERRGTWKGKEKGRDERLTYIHGCLNTSSISNRFLGSVFKSLIIRSLAEKVNEYKVNEYRVNNTGLKIQDEMMGLRDPYRHQKFVPIQLMERSNHPVLFSFSCQEKWELHPCCRREGTHTVYREGKGYIHNGEIRYIIKNDPLDIVLIK